MLRLGFKLLVCAAVLSASGCQDPPPPISLDTADVTPAVNYSPLSKVLDESVTPGGMLSRRGLAASEDALLRQVKLLAVTGPTASPELFETPDGELAYWYNARCAWSLKLVADADRQGRDPPVEPTDRSFPLDGRMMTLSDIDDILARDDDFRVLIASPGACSRRAAPPGEPFTAADVRERLARRFEQFVADDERFRIDVAARQVHVPPVLWRLRDRVIADYEQTYGAKGAKLSTAMLPHLSGRARRRLQNAVGYGCVPAPSKCEPILTDP